MSVIKVFRNHVVERELPLSPRIKIGRGSGNQLQIENSFISREHAEIVVDDTGQVTVCDLSSVNGTLVNKRHLPTRTPVVLKTGDWIAFGRLPEYQLQVVLDQAETRAMVRQRPPEPAAPPPPKPSPLMQHLLAGCLPVWSKGSLQVRVSDIIDEAPGVKTYRFVGKEPVLFSYKPGQFITLALMIDGKRVLRSYSLSSAPSRPHVLEITVKRVPDGLVSNWLADKLKLGDTLEITAPGGTFSCFEFPSQKMLFIGAGSGVTPLMSMTRWIIDTTAEVDVKFLISARSPADIIFHRELEYLSSRHMGLHCIATITARAGGAVPWLGHHGRVSRQMLEMFAPDLADRHVFLCGPPGFSEGVVASLTEMGFPMQNLHTESFVPGRVAKGTKVEARDLRPGTSHYSRQQAKELREGAAPAAVPAAPGFKIRFRKSNKDLRTSGTGSLLELAEMNGIEIDNACRSGFCGVCKARCISGKVEMKEQQGLAQLSDSERAQYVLTCVAMPTSDVEIDA